MKREEHHVMLCPKCGAELGQPHILENKFFSSAYPFFECKSCDFIGTDPIEVHSQEEIEKVRKGLRK